MHCVCRTENFLIFNILIRKAITGVYRINTNLTFFLQVKAKSSKWHRDLHTAIPIILGTVPLTTYQQPVVPAGLKSPEEVNGETANVPAGTGGAPIGYNVPPPMGEPQAPGAASWNIPSSDSNAQSQETPDVQPNMPPQGPAPTPSLYPYLCKYMRIAGYLCSLLYKQLKGFLHVNFLHISCCFISLCDTESVLKSLYLQLRNSTLMEPRHSLLYYDKGYQKMPLSFVIFLYLYVPSLHVSGLYQPIIRGIPSCCLFVTAWFT